jgi:hypothetical protein
MMASKIKDNLSTKDSLRLKLIQRSIAFIILAVVMISPLTMLDPQPAQRMIILAVVQVALLVWIGSALVLPIWIAYHNKLKEPDDEEELFP